MSIVRAILIMLAFLGFSFFGQEVTAQPWSIAIGERDVVTTSLKWVLYASAIFLLGLFAYEAWHRHSIRKRFLGKRHKPHR